MPNSPPTALLSTNLTSNRLPTSVYLRSTEEKGQYISLIDVTPVLTGISGKFSSSQLAEGDCSVVVSGASSFENHAVEESKIMPFEKLLKISEASVPYLCLTVVGTIATFGLTLASISIVALGAGSDISLKVPLGSDTQSVEFKTNSNQETPK